jgi:3-oxoadipate enol-lactonase
MKFYKSENMKFAYQDTRSGFPVVLIHGMGSDHNIWSGLISLLKENYRVLAADLRGHGSSSETPGPYSMELFSQDILNLLKSMDINRAHFIGHSMGGAIAQDLAINYPDMVTSLTLIASFAYPSYPLRRILTNLRNTLYQEGYNEFFDECLEIAHNPQYIKENKELLNQFREDMSETSSIFSLISAINACLNVNYSDSLKDISSPTLIIAGEKDRFISKDQRTILSRGIPNSKFKLISEANHNMIIEEPQKVYDIIKPFLDKY